MERTKETPYEGGYAQWFVAEGNTIRIHTTLPWEELGLRMRDWYTERAEEYFRVRNHKDRGRFNDD